MGDGQACCQSSTAGSMAVTTFLGGTRFVARSPLSLTNYPTLLKIALVLFSCAVLACKSMTTSVTARVE